MRDVCVLSPDSHLLPAFFNGFFANRMKDEMEMTLWMKFKRLLPMFPIWRVQEITNVTSKFSICVSTECVSQINGKVNNSTIFDVCVLALKNLIYEFYCRPLNIVLLWSFPIATFPTTRTGSQCQEIPKGFFTGTSYILCSNITSYPFTPKSNWYVNSSNSTKRFIWRMVTR